ncbi:hypothetical protein QVD17_36482 [Tagetes erecta]|uniref:Uncharacterized protein n=1 Tax=Tagetes erecta TaxID=13708 RepID=A0AAD8NJ16_TARER|nr:hypothetical protein QVD17_36482 [Tagetes erecta]
MSCCIYVCLPLCVVIQLHLMIASYLLPTAVACFFFHSDFITVFCFIFRPRFNFTLTFVFLPLSFRYRFLKFLFTLAIVGFFYTVVHHRFHVLRRFSFTCSFLPAIIVPVLSFFYM